MTKNEEFLKIFSELEENTQDDVIRIEGRTIASAAKKILSAAALHSPEAKEIILIAPSGLRHTVYLVLSQYITNIRAIAREEIASEYQLKILGRI